MTETPTPTVSWHAIGADEVAARLSADLDLGLKPAEAKRRLGEYGLNRIEAEAGPGRLEILVDQFLDVLIWVLIAAAFVSGVVLDEWIDAVVILAIVALNSAIGYSQEARAEDALARLKELAAPEAVVIRGGGEREIPSQEVVPGDLVVLEAGTRVPADGRVVTAAHLEVDESALTGESMPSAKTTQPVAEGIVLADRVSMLYSSTAISAGRGRMLVTGTGRNTAVGGIAGLLTEEEAPTPLQVELNAVGKRLALLAAATAVVVFGAGLVRGNPAESMFLTAVALAVAAIPEGLPAVVTITLSRGVQRMAAENAIVRRLPAVEALGSATVICTDKTGTLTRNEMRVQEVMLGGLRAEMPPPGDTRTERYVEVAVLANDARRTPEGEYLGDPTEVALLMSAEAAGADVDRLREGMPRLDELSFDSRRKRMATLHRSDGYLLLVKGAPEVVLAACSRVEGSSGPEPLEGERHRRVLVLAEELAGRGLRTLALAYRALPALPEDLAGAEEGLVLVAVVGMSDAARPEAAPSVAEAQRAGIKVVMVTGDHAVTARAIASEVGILAEEDLVMTGAELAKLTVEELAPKVHSYSVYARVDPVDKVKIVQAWQSAGETVAMTGDGVNDAPALRRADIGVAMGSGTDVAKDSSDMVLADDNFATIVSAVREGRGIFASLEKVVYFLLSANASEVLVMFLGFLVFGSLGEPLVAVQLLWINLVTDGLPALAMGVDPPPAGTMDVPPERGRQILSARRQLRLLIYGSVLAGATLAMLVVGHYILDLPWPEVQTAIFTAIVVVQMLHAFNIRTPDRHFWEGGFTGNRLLLAGVIGSLALHLAVVYSPVGATLFDTVAFDAELWLWMIPAAVASFVVVDALKRPLRRLIGS